MTFALKQRTLTFLVTIMLLAHTNVATAPLSDVPKLTQADLADLTHGLSDVEVEKALSELSLSDLNVLNSLIDASNSADYNYEEGSFLTSNERAIPFDGFKFDEVIGGNDYDDSGDDDPASNAEVGLLSLGGIQIPRVALVSEDILRPKRDSSKQPEQVVVDEEYIKQLENSFPRDQEQSGNEGNEENREHIRIKRN